VRLYTARSVELAPFEDALGRSAEGFEASFIVLDRDIFAKVGVVNGVDAIFGLHVMNRKAGTIQVTRGAATTGADGFYLTAEGRGTRGSMPQGGIDPVLVGSQIVLGPADPGHELFSRCR